MRMDCMKKQHQKSALADAFAGGNSVHVFAVQFDFDATVRLVASGSSLGVAQITPVEPFPVMEVSAITHKRAPVFHATVVGKPPLEDKFMGYATERIFLPLFRTSAPDLIDYKMPENGVFHNLIFNFCLP